MAGLKIHVAPVQRESVQRRHLKPVQLFDPNKKQFIDTGKVTHQNKASGATESIGFYEIAGSGKYKTGLDEMVVNPFKGQEISTLKSVKNLSDKWVPILESLSSDKKTFDADKISRQQWYEILDGVEPHTYTSVRSQSFIGDASSYDPKKERTFVEKFRVTLYDGTNVFTADTQRGRFAIQVIKNCPFVAPNKELANSNYHNWYIAAENEEELEQVKTFDLENDAIFELTSIQKKYPESKLYQLAVVVRDQNNMSLVKGEVAPQIVKAQLNKFIKTKSRHKAENIERFLEVVEIFKDNPQLFEVKYMVSQGYNTNLLYNSGEGYLIWKTKQNNSTVYRWKNKDVFESFLLEESEKYNPKGNEINYYGDFKEELKLKGVPF